MLQILAKARAYQNIRGRKKREYEEKLIEEGRAV